MKPARLAFAFACVLPILQACSGPAPATPAATGPSPAAATAPDSPAPAATTVISTDPRQACNLVTATEMSAILDSAVVATPHDPTEGVTECTYSPAGDRGPTVEMTTYKSDGGSPLDAVREMSHHDAAADLPYKGIGDDSVYEGPAVVILQGDDIISLTINGVADAPAAARKIVAVAKARM